MLDDPKFIVSGDPLYELLYTSVPYLGNVACFGAPIFILLTWVLRNRYSRLWAFFLVMIFVLSWMMLLFDSGARLTWYAD